MFNAYFSWNQNHLIGGGGEGGGVTKYDEADSLSYINVEDLNEHL